MTIKIDYGDFKRAAKDMGAMADQVPFALSRAMNDAADIARQYLIDDVWPNSIHARNKSFIKASLSRKHMVRATKKDLYVAVVDGLGRGHLEMHADGGSRRMLSGKRIAVPNIYNNSRRKADGSMRLKPLAIKDSFVLNGSVYQRFTKGSGKNKTKHRRVMYSLKNATKIRKDVPFREKFARRFQDEIRTRFAVRIGEAMKTRKLR